MNAILILAALLVSALTKNLWDITYPGLYNQGNAVAWLIFCIPLYRMANDYWLNRLALLALVWAIFDVLDAIIFDPYITGCNEWLAAGLTVICVFWKVIRYGRHKSELEWRKQQRKQGRQL